MARRLPSSSGDNCKVRAMGFCKIEEEKEPKETFCVCKRKIENGGILSVLWLPAKSTLAIFRCSCGQISVVKIEDVDQAFDLQDIIQKRIDMV